MTQQFYRPRNTSRTLVLGRTRSQTRVRDVPLVEDTNTEVQVCGEAQPCNIRHETPACNLVDLEERVGQVAVEAQEGEDVDEGDSRLAHAEEQRLPDKVETELERVERANILLAQVGGQRAACG